MAPPSLKFNPRMNAAPRFGIGLCVVIVAPPKASPIVQIDARQGQKAPTPDQLSGRLGKSFATGRKDNLADLFLNFTHWLFMVRRCANKDRQIYANCLLPELSATITDNVMPGACLAEGMQEHVVFGRLSKFPVDLHSKLAPYPA